MGMALRSPLVVGSSGLTRTAEGVRRCAEAGAGAVVLKSIFEEAIAHEVQAALDAGMDSFVHPEAMDYVKSLSRDNEVGNYLRLIADAKKGADIPVVASVHCVSASAWPDFAKQVQDAGADALELNAFVLPADGTRDSAAIEKVYLDMAAAVREKVRIPVAMKLSCHLTSIPHTAMALDRAGIRSLTLFNRFFVNDIDIEKLALKRGGFLSSPEEYLLPMRWMSLLHGRLSCDLAASTGVHSASSAIKLLLAGATVVQVVSALYRNELSFLSTMNAELAAWMDRQQLATIEAFRGHLSQKASGNPAAFERVQFMKFSVGME